MTEQELHARATEIWLSQPKYMRRHWKSHAEVIKYVVSSITRGWSFLGVSVENHEKTVADYTHKLRNWTPPK